MTDRIATLTVILKEDMREDDLMALVGAIRMLHPVEAVTFGAPVSMNDAIERERLRARIGAQVFNLIAGRKVLTE